MQLTGRPFRSEFVTLRFVRCPEIFKLTVLVTGGGILLGVKPPRIGADRLYEILESQELADDIIVGSMFQRLMRVEWFDALPSILHTPLSSRYRAQRGRLSFHLHELALLAAAYAQLGQANIADAVVEHGLFADSATQDAYEIIKTEGHEGFVREFGQLAFSNAVQQVPHFPQPCEMALGMLSIATLQELRDTGIGDAFRDASDSNLRILNRELIDEVLRLRSAATPEEWLGEHVDELLRQIC